MGFSLDPYAFPRAFSRASDIDVLVVDETLFDSIWFGALEWHYAQPLPLVPPATEWASCSSAIRRLYLGMSSPGLSLALKVSKIPYGCAPSVTLAMIGSNAFQSLSRLKPFAA